MDWKERQQTLEQLIDAHGLATVLDDLAIICAGKAEHVRSTYADNSLADLWEKNSDRIGRTIPLAHLL